jgi:hypothetical protein
MKKVLLVLGILLLATLVGCENEGKYIKYPGVYFKIENAYIQDLTKYFLEKSTWPKTAEDMGEAFPVSKRSNQPDYVMVDQVFLDYKSALFKSDGEKFVFEYNCHIKESGLLPERELNYFIFDDSVCFDSRAFCLNLGKKPRAEFLVKAINCNGRRRLEFQFMH